MVSPQRQFFLKGGFSCIDGFSCWTASNVELTGHFHDSGSALIFCTEGASQDLLMERVPWGGEQGPQSPVRFAGNSQHVLE